ncbi:MAG: GGDEF domain-containing protein [Lachnospiraceae bacterium]|nr:GGDEF domain-containing protein [Lachnospiraceae bacterium]
MKGIGSIRKKYIILIVLLGIIPMTVAIGVLGVGFIRAAFGEAKREGALYNEVIHKHIAGLIENDKYVLRANAKDSDTVYALKHPEDKEALSIVADKIDELNELFNDGNNMIITNAAGQQLHRSDGLDPVQVVDRRYYREAIHGRECVSEVVASHATGKMIIVIEVPVFSNEGKPIGLVQRDYNITALQDFILDLDDSDSVITLFDEEGRRIADSSKEAITEKDMKESSEIFPLVSEASSEVKVNSATIAQEKCIISYSRDELTGWTIATYMPYSSIFAGIYRLVLVAVVLGVVLLLVVLLAARTMAIHIDGMRLSAEIDKLTQLYNKASTDRICRYIIAKNAPGTLSALYIIDLDHFKDVNDTKGHSAGDYVLREFADALQRLFKPDDCVGRFGGDEFIVMLRDLPGLDAVREKARQVGRIASAIEYNGTSANITASIGIATTPVNGDDYDTLFKEADRAVYAVKNDGRNGFCFHGEIEHFGG